MISMEMKHFNADQLFLLIDRLISYCMVNQPSLYCHFPNSVGIFSEIWQQQWQLHCNTRLLKKKKKKKCRAILITKSN